MLDPAVVEAVVAPVSAWTPATIGVLLTGAAGLTAALGTAAGLIIKEIRANAAQGMAAGQIRDQKLNRIETLVDGRYSDVLRELAVVKAQLAVITGDHRDVAKALIAQENSNRQDERVLAVESLLPPTPPGPID